MTIDMPIGGGRPVGAIPRVDLLPGEVREQAAARSTRRVMLLLIVLAVVLVGAGFGGAQFLVASSAAGLDTANQQTQQLISQQSAYARVRTLQAAVQEADALDRVTTATQIDWQAMLSEVLAPLPAAVGVGAIQVDSQSPIDAPSQSQSPFGQAAIGTVAIDLTATDIDALTTWLATMRADQTFASVTALQAQNADGTWHLSATLFISPTVTALATPAPTPAPTAGGQG